MEKSDVDLKNDVLSELRFQPSVKMTDIGVLVDKGTVTLNGFVHSYGEKCDAVRATKRVAGVVAIADDIVVKLPDSLHRTDGEIAAAAAQQLEWTPMIPVKSVTVTVREGWITLEGSVEWWYQKHGAESAVHNLFGVKGVSNMISIKPNVAANDIASSIQAAFKRSAALDSEKIEVETSGSDVTLRGKVRNYAEEEEAERVAWAAPGVKSVHNRLTVRWF